MPRMWVRMLGLQGSTLHAHISPFSRQHPYNLHQDLQLGMGPNNSRGWGQ